MLQGIGGKDARDAGIEARAEQRRDACFLEAIVVVPLPLVLELRRVLRLIVRRIDVMRLRRKARIHDLEILIGQREVQNDIGLLPLDQVDELRHIVRVHLRRPDLRLASRQLFLQRVALRLRAARDADLLEHVAVLAALVHGNARNAARTDDQSLSHDVSSCHQALDIRRSLRPNPRRGSLPRPKRAAFP